MLGKAAEGGAISKVKAAVKVRAPATEAGSVEGQVLKGHVLGIVFKVEPVAPRLGSAETLGPSLHGAISVAS